MEIWRLQEDTKCVKIFVIMTNQPTENVEDDMQEELRFEFNISKI